MIDQYVEDNRMYFWSTINREETQFEADMSQEHGALIEAVIMSGPRIGETRMVPALALMALYEQQQEGEDDV
tara:strand:- start:343 stop:558 length:216 start_codon:yes stop_codon:yes gene_type:complete